MLIQHISGVINLSIPVIIIFYMSPGLLDNPFGPLGVALVLGLYIWYLNYKQHRAGMAQLIYAPTGKHKELFDSWIKSCEIHPDRVSLRYAYTAEQFAMTMGPVIIIDPICFSVCLEDSTSAQVHAIFTQYVEPTLLENAKKRLALYKEMLTLSVQCFLFKHELGHVAARFALKKLFLIFITGFLASYAGIVSAKLLIAFNPYVAIIIGMIVGGSIDLLLAYLTNWLFKSVAEKRADLFAARYSSREEIIAAAHFFEKLDEVRQEYKDSEHNSFLQKLPTSLTLGYPTGKERSAYLLKNINA